MIHGTENALLVHIVKNLWLGKDSLPEMTNPIAPIVLENYSQSDVPPVPSQSQEKVALEIPNSLPLKNWLGTMNVLFVAFVTNLWLEKDLFKKRVALFAQSVLEKKCWRRWRLKIRNKFFPR